MKSECIKCNESKSIMSIPYVVHESMAIKVERKDRRNFFVILALVATILINNAGWLLYLNNSEIVSYQQDGHGCNNINIGTQGDVLSGTESSNP